MITIITVCYNSAAVIRGAFESVLSQDYRDIDYIVVDGGSTDGTVDVIKEYEPKFSGRLSGGMRWVSERDNGLYDAMNKGIRMASGEIVGILNSDDVYADNHVVSDIANAFAQEKTDAVYGDLLYVKNGRPYRYWRAGCQRSFVTGWMPPHPAFFVRRELYAKYGAFRLDCGTAADYELMLRFLEKRKASAAYVPRTLVFMAAGGASGAGVKARLRAAIFDDYAWEINGLRPAFYTMPLKKISKLFQFGKKSSLNL
jgi:glycosyltransferase involved in cell wall biosynthesis